MMLQRVSQLSRSGIATAVRTTISQQHRITSNISSLASASRTTTLLQSSMPMPVRSPLLSLRAHSDAGRQQHPRYFSAATLSDAAKEGNPNKFAIVMQNMTKRIGGSNSSNGGRTLFKDVTLSFFDGAKIGIVGVNGSGKSSYMKILAGLDQDYDGTCTVSAGMRVGHLAQEPVLDDAATVHECIMEGVRVQTELLAAYEHCCNAFAAENADYDALTAQQSDIQAQIEAMDCWQLEHRIQQSIAALRCPPGDALISTLSGGEKRRVALCRLLLSQPDILLLDEPTNHLDAVSVAWLEQFLSQYSGLVIAITHDRYFLDNVAGYILELDAGACIPYRGNYGGWLQQKMKRREGEKKRNERNDRLMARELEWLQKGAAGAQRKQNKARVNKIELMATLEQERKSNARAEGGALVIPAGPRLGKEVITVTDASFVTDSSDAVAAGVTLMHKLSFTVARGDVLGVVGPNGSGKTTLLKLLTGERQCTTGSVAVGDTVMFGYNSQSRDTLNEDRMLWQEIVGERQDVVVAAGVTMPARAYVAQFNFSGVDQQKRISSLSGGERNRVHLAKSLVDGCNVLILDEPTNDLDVDTLRALEEALCEFDGAAIVVSHDRWFLDRVCTHVLSFEADNKTVFFDGNYSAYEMFKQTVLGEAKHSQKRFKNINV